MKKSLYFSIIVCLICLFPFTANANGNQKQVKVSNETELLSAIGSDTHIILTSGYYNLTNCDGFANDKIDSQIGWGESENGETYPAESYIINNVNNLTIEGNAKIVTEDLIGAALTFQQCSNIKIDGLTMGHLNPYKEYQCEGPVIAAYNCSKLTINNCNLFGCGAEGLYADNVNDIEINNSRIYECTYTGIWLAGESNAVVNDSEFSNSTLCSGFLRIDNSQITCNNCVIKDIKCDFYGEKFNLITTFDYEDAPSSITLNGCKIKNNSFSTLTNSETSKLILANCELEDNNGEINSGFITQTDNGSHKNVTNNDGEIKVLIDGKMLEFDVQPTIINDRTMVPVRKIFESLGAAVYWYDDTQTIISRKNDVNIEMIIDNHLMSIDGKVIYLDVPPTIIGERTLVPVRAISEAFGYKVDWLNNVVSITTSAE